MKAFGLMENENTMYNVQCFNLANVCQLDFVVDSEKQEKIKFSICCEIQKHPKMCALSKKCTNIQIYSFICSAFHGFTQFNEFSAQQCMISANSMENK